MNILNNFLNIDNLTTFITSWFLLISVLIIVGLLVRFRTQVIGFLKSTRFELTKVEWLSKNETRNYTIINIIFIIAMTILIFSLDQTFLFVRNLLI